MTLSTSDENLDYTMSHQYAHTIAFQSVPTTTGDEITNGEAMKRRVSFAPNAHVR